MNKRVRYDPGEPGNREKTSSQHMVY